MPQWREKSGHSKVQILLNLQGDNHTQSSPVYHVYFLKFLQGQSKATQGSGVGPFPSKKSDQHPREITVHYVANHFWSGHLSQLIFDP